MDLQFTQNTEDVEQPVKDNVRHIGWNELDKRKYYVFGPTCMIGVRLLIFPSLLIKTRLQVQKQSSVYNGAYDAFKKIVKYEGMRGLYRGFATNTLTLISGQIYVTVLEVARVHVPGPSQTTKSLLAGMCASLAGQTVTVPIDIISQKQMMFSQNHTKISKFRVNRSAWCVIQQIYRTSGIHGFYKGYVASLLAYTPSSGIFWASYYSLTQFFNRHTPSSTPTIVIQGMSGPAASAVASILTNPADTVRTRLQVEGGSATIPSVVQRLYYEEGFRALHKGLTARLMSSVPAGFILSIAYEIVKRLSLKNEFR